MGDERVMAEVESEMGVEKEMRVQKGARGCMKGM